jgi:hypothetical protein
MGQFTVNYPGDKSQLIAKLKSMVGNKGEVAGNESAGQFKGDTPVGGFEGSYQINGDEITVNVDKKPFLVSTSRIKEEFEKAIQKGI